MRRVLMVVPFLFACAKGGETPADSAAAAVAPAALTEADVAGVWTGTLMPEGSDSVIAHWSVTIGGGTYRLTTTESPKDTASGTYVLEGDSSRYSAPAHADPTFGGAMVTDGGVSRFNGTQITGTGSTRLAAKPDSVLLKYHFTGTKTP